MTKLQVRRHINKLERHGHLCTIQDIQRAAEMLRWLSDMVVHLADNRVIIGWVGSRSEWAKIRRAQECETLALMREVEP